ncbi:hypothetical protein NAV25_05370 [Pseudomonas stutzeri]|nr:hypothetical protein [Stutzerimonas decontaminans]MCQ4244460.1 hypothetical protein [Stutzerimonas decontaminans]
MSGRLKTRKHVWYINGEYDAKWLDHVLAEVVGIIGANILNIAGRYYEPQVAGETIPFW